VVVDSIDYMLLDYNMLDMSVVDVLNGADKNDIVHTSPYNSIFLHFKLSPCSECCILSFG
jgi:hypothetical protein